MNLATLGATIDIHTGGEDNIFPHHEAEIAQSECGNSAPFVRYWIHTRHLFVDGMKMSKSKGNFYTLEDILNKGFSAMDLRMLYLSAHYRSQMNFTWDALGQAKVNRTTLINTFERLKAVREPLTGTPSFELNLFEAALENDINTPLALSILLRYAANINRALDEKDFQRLSGSDLGNLSSMLFDFFGLQEEKVEIPETVQILLRKREMARNQKDYARSDALRDEIGALGYLVEDGPEGQTVRKK
jgi:cysteinyl-tRNA synthetase